ncbi:MAG: hypothetical protein HEQ25_22125 [Dolichospermum sp. DET73]|nr:hypothetical protein [Dolichospermum sp. DET73]
MAARTTKKTAVIDPNYVSIADFCQSQGINEQIFRLELMQHCDDADSTKTCDFSVATQVASTIQATSKALPQNIETPENLTTEALQPAPPLATEQPQKPQNSSIVGNTPKAISSPATGANIPTALEELIQDAQENIELADLVHSYRNQQILTNAKSRDSELVVQLRERRLETRNQVFDSLRNLNARQPVPQELPELPGLADEISGLCNELGKSLNRAA